MEDYPPPNHPPVRLDLDGSWLLLFIKTKNTYVHIHTHMYIYTYIYIYIYLCIYIRVYSHIDWCHAWKLCNGTPVLYREIPVKPVQAGPEALRGAGFTALQLRLAGFDAWQLEARMTSSLSRELGAL